MKKITGIAVLTVSIIIGSFLACGPGRTVKYSECIVSREQSEDIASEREETPHLIGELVFGEETLFYDDSDGTFYYSLIEGNADACDPRIRIKSEEKDVKLAFTEKGITEDGMKKNETISFLAYTDEACCRYYLKCTTLPLMDIECPVEIPDDAVPMNITLFDNGIGAAERVVRSEGEIHLRGATARAYPKKGFRFSLRTESVGGNVRPNHISLLNMRQDDDWLLYAGYNDQEKIRNVFSSNLWKNTCAADNAQGIDFGMEYRYLELFINGKYWGLYALGYPIDEKQVFIGGDDGSILYKHGLGSERLQFTKDGGIFGDRKESPDEAMRSQSFLQRYYYDLYVNADNNERLYAGIDIDNAIDFYLFINLVQGTDNVDLIKNYYILLRQEKEGTKAFYAPWDLDLTWGNHYIGVAEENFTYPYAHSADYNCIIESGYMNQLMINGDRAVWERIFEKYRIFRENGWSEEAVNAMLDEYEADIFGSGAYLRDMERWPGGTYGNTADELRVFRTYVMDRLREADLYYERLKIAYEGNANVFIRRSMQYKDLLERRFLIEINDHDLLRNPDYADFLKYVGADVSAITEEVRFILADPAGGKAEYLPSLCEGEEPGETCIGRLSFTRLREGVYDVKVDGAECYRTTIFEKPGIKMAIINDTERCEFNFTDGYDMQEQSGSFEELAFYIEALAGTGYRAVMEINDPAIWQNRGYAALFGKLGVAEEELCADTDFIVWNGLEKAAFALDDIHASGGSFDTPLGSLGLFWNEWGEYGVYLDGFECFVSSQEKNRDVDIRIVLLDPESYDRADMITYSDDLR
ncbi:MAG: CotH kinase family protein [Blautia sp.]|nr:CotH kinase family protein [Blautia sp.]MCM1202123.1 CotH kinase family protein [Bacteroides fragilis]